MKSLIVIPTYNEAENIKNLIAEIRFLNLSDLDILVIDDNSPDQTFKIVESLQADFQNLHLIKRAGKLGLASAYLAGFQWALEHNYDLIIEMDADFSHQPKYLADFIKQAQTYDLVIGSRYVKGGGVAGWTWLRRIISRFGCLYAQLILGIKVKDLTGGFNAWHSEVFNKVDLNNIKSHGYSFQIELKYQAIRQGFKFTEMPIIFVDRFHGQSKMSKKILLEAIWRVWYLKFRKFKS